MPSDSERLKRERGALDAALATLAYAALTIALTWPLARGLARDVPSDFGDPLLNCWIVAWDADHLLQALGGHPAALGEYWNANIFHPHPLALAYSDHLTAQALQILPVWALTKNPLLCHNLLWLSTFVLSGVGMFLLARELTANRGAAFVAGLAYAFAPYRFGSLPHLQVLSSAWMPFVLLGLRRFFETRRTAPLAGASAAWILQNLSCSYYLIFFSPVLALYVAWEVTTRRLWSDVRTLARVAAAGAAAVLLTVPFVLPYVALRRSGFVPRSLEETEHFSADVYSYLTADANLRVWGNVMRAWPKAEGWLYPGLTIFALAAIGVVVASREIASARRSGGWTPAERILVWLLAASCAVMAAILFGWSLRLPFLKITSLDRVRILAAVLAVALLALSARARATARAWLTSPVGLFLGLTLFAAAMSLGPHVHSRGKLVEDTNVYAPFYNWVPGFDGLRVPARFGMIVALGWAVLAAYGACAIGRLRHGRFLVMLAGALVVVESIAVPLPLNGNDTTYKQRDLVPLPDFVAVGDRTPAVYRFVAQLPASAVLVEMPFGEIAFETRYMLYSTTHWRKLVNGYSGGAPDEYGLLSESLKDMARRPQPAWNALVASGATHVIVHEASYAGGRGGQVSEWLRANGARDLAAFDRDRVLELPR